MLFGMSYTRNVLSSAPHVRRQTPSGDHRAPFRWLSCGIQSCVPDDDAPFRPALTANSVVKVSADVGADACVERSSAYSRMDRGSSGVTASAGALGTLTAPCWVFSSTGGSSAGGSSAGGLGTSSGLGTFLGRPLGLLGPVYASFFFGGISIGWRSSTALRT